ncbi:MAG TPA: hypothetical protein VGM92_14960 [Candidatus Kapabacteria bacterium]|jgi:hypothetical protein
MAAITNINRNKNQDVNSGDGFNFDGWELQLSPGEYQLAATSFAPGWEQEVIVWNENIWQPRAVDVSSINIGGFKPNPGKFTVPAIPNQPQAKYFLALQYKDMSWHSAESGSNTGDGDSVGFDFHIGNEGTNITLSAI